MPEPEEKDTKVAQQEVAKSGTFRLALAIVIGAILVLGATVIITMLFGPEGTREKLGLMAMQTIGQLVTAVGVYFFTRNQSG